MTTAYRAVGGAASNANRRARLPWELSAPAATYGDLVPRMRAAYDLGYSVVYDDDASSIRPASDAIMNALLPLVDDLPYFDHLVVPMWSKTGTGDACLALYNVASANIEMAPASGGHGGVIVADSGVPILDLSGGNGRGLIMPIDNASMVDVGAGKTDIVVVKFGSVSGSGAPRIVSILTPAATILVSLHLNRPAGTLSIDCRRTISGTLRQQTATGAAVSAGEWMELALYRDFTGGTLRVERDGSEYIAPTTWYSAGAGTLNVSIAANLCRIGIPGASSAFDAQIAIYAILNTVDPGIVDPIRVKLRALCAPLLT